MISNWQVFILYFILDQGKRNEWKNCESSFSTAFFGISCFSIRDKQRSDTGRGRHHYDGSEPRDLYLARLMIYKFISLIPELYGLYHVKYNVHILLHLLDFVENWGAPWAYSAFIFEDAGGRLKRYVHSSHHIAEEIFTKYLASQKLLEFAAQYIPQSPKSFQNLFEAVNGPLKKHHKDHEHAYSPFALNPWAVRKEWFSLCPTLLPLSAVITCIWIVEMLSFTREFPYANEISPPPNMPTL